MDISALTDEISGYRYLIIDRYIVFYRVIESEIIVVSIIDGRTDYMKYLLSGLRGCEETMKQSSNLHSP